MPPRAQSCKKKEKPPTNGAAAQIPRTGEFTDDVSTSKKEEQATRTSSGYSKICNI